MKLYHLLIIMFLLQVFQLTGQQFYAYEGAVSFVADAPLEKIEGKSEKIITEFDAESFVFEISLDMNSFEFAHPLLKYHFEKNIAQVDSFPRAFFKGKIQKPDKEALISDKIQDIKVDGFMNFHGITKSMLVKGKITGSLESKSIRLKSSFDLILKDFGIVIPPFVRDAWASVVQVQVEVVLKKRPLK